MSLESKMTVFRRYDCNNVIKTVQYLLTLQKARRQLGIRTEKVEIHSSQLITFYCTNGFKQVKFVDREKTVILPNKVSRWR